MNFRRNRTLAIVAALVLSFGFAIATTVIHFSVGRGDPDLSYHLALSKMSAQQGLPRTLQQAEDIGWGQKFPEKEFLFHRVSTILYRLGGESVVESMVPIFAGLTFLLLLFAVSRFVPFVVAVLIVLGGVVLTDPFVWRMSLLRPQILAIFLFAAAVFGLLVERRWIVVLSCFAFPLAYHAIYLLAVPIVLSPFLSSKKGRRRFDEALIGCGALALGVILNPYFPQSLGMGWRHLQIALLELGTQNRMDFGNELIPWPTDVFLANLLYFVAVILLSLGRLLALARKSRVEVFNPEVRRLSYLLILSSAFWALAMKNPRAIEYAVPVSTLLLAVALNGVVFNYRIILTAACLTLLLQFSSMRGLYEKLRTPVMPTARTAVERALHAVPVDPTRNKVFNCNWSDGSYIFHLRPDLKFVDLLDPSFLRVQSAAKYEGRQALLAGAIADAHTLVRRDFSADYVLCRAPAAVARLARDPGFRQIYPPILGSAGKEYSVFEVAPRNVADRAFASKYEAAALPSMDSLNFLSVSPRTVGKREWSAIQRSTEPYIDLAAWLEKKGVTPSPNEHERVRCVAIRPNDEEIVARKGATVVGFGGGLQLRVWFNDQPLYFTETPVAYPRLVQQFVPLPHPVRAGDRIETIACSLEGIFHGFVLSFWTARMLEQICQWKMSGQGSDALRTNDPFVWPWTGGAEKGSCLADYARSKSRVGVPADTNPRSRN